MIERADKRTGKNRSKIRTALDGTTDIRAVSVDRQSGWTPCSMNNGGCTHLCFFLKKSYTCGCPDQPDHKPCSTCKYYIAYLMHQYVWFVFIDL